MEHFARLAAIVLFFTAMQVVTKPWSDAVDTRHDQQCEEIYKPEYVFACKVGNAPIHRPDARKASQP